MARHTPGPWRSEINLDPRYLPHLLILGDSLYPPVAALWESQEMAQANARLIAAAPDLLLFAQELVSLVNSDLTGIRESYELKNMITTIAKARGDD